jgi:HD-GYP domain-containing protein (c-di-GMP phosphodiesterase class II)
MNETGKPGLGGRENALRYVKDHSGTMFDPEIAGLFVRLMEEDGD